MFALAAPTKFEARALIRGTLIRQHRSLEELVAQLLVVNNRVQDEAAPPIGPSTIASRARS